MKIAVNSKDFKTVTGKAGRSRHFLIYEVDAAQQATLVEQLTVPDEQPIFHNLHDDDTTPHPIDGMHLITTEAGEGFTERLARRQIQVHITSETDPDTAVKLLLAGELPAIAPTPHRADDEDCQH